jgi:hypothetical protein
MIASALDLTDDESYAVEIIYHGLLVGRPSGCNSPTFNNSPEGRNDPPHVDVKINFAYLEWKCIASQIPINDWIWDLRYTREARLFAEGELKLVPNTWNPQLGVYDIVYVTTHHWHHHKWDHIANKWLPNYTKPDSHPMQAYLELRMLEANLRSTISSKYRDSTYLTTNCGTDHGLGAPSGKTFRWTTLYDFSGQVTYPGANAGDEYRRIPADEGWYSNRPRWPGVNAVDEYRRIPADEGWYSNRPR